MTLRFAHSLDLKLEISNLRFLIWMISIAFWPALETRGQALRVEAEVRARDYHVGQGLELMVGVVAGKEPPRVEPPAVANARVAAIAPRDGDREPVVSSGIGAVVAERLRYVFRFRIVPDRAGPLVIPPVSVRDGDRVGKGPPIRLTIRAVPSAGRPNAFLGGVGTLEVDASAEPATVRAGQPLEHRVRLEGTAARGSSRRPDLEAIGPLPLGPRVEPLPDLASDDPPWRIIRHRLRWAEAGDLALPPVPIAYFDPDAGHYFTRTTPEVPVRVVAVPDFEPARLDFEPTTRADPRRARRRPATIAGLAIVAAGLAGQVLRAIVRRWRRSRGDDPRRLAARLARDLGAEADLDGAVVAIHDALGAYLALASGRPRGVLTPVEARREFGRLSHSGDAAIADEAESLVAACDASRYGPTAEARATVALVNRARRLFDGLAKRGIPRGGIARRDVGEDGPKGGTSDRQAMGAIGPVPPSP